MRRSIALSVGAAAVAAAGFLLGPAVRAGEGDEGEKRVEKRVVIRHAGGGFLGVALGDVEGDARGALVRSVESGGPAEQAGIEKDDVIVRFDGEAVRSAGQLARLVRETPAGRAVAIELLRGGATQKLDVTLGKARARGFGEGLPGLGEFHFELPDPPALPHGAAPPAPRPHVWRFDRDAGPMLQWGERPRRLGVEYVELGEQLAAYLKLAKARGVLVTSVEAGSPAATAGVKAGDVILELGGRRIDDGGDLREAVADTEDGREVTLAIHRDGRPLELKVTLAKPKPKSREAGVRL